MTVRYFEGLWPLQTIPRADALGPWGGLEPTHYKITANITNNSELEEEITQLFKAYMRDRMMEINVKIERNKQVERKYIERTRQGRKM